jgi:serine/threonine protein kinase
VVALPDGLKIGDVVADKYEILRVIGVGAMGVVVAARHRNLDCTVALKFLVASALGHPDALARFAQEARAPAKIKSPHVVRVNDVASLSSGTPYIELEYLEGSDLAARLRSEGRLPVDLAVDFVLQACDGVGEVHGLGIIHRDLKPANLFIVRGHAGAEEIRVLDFGISKARASVTSTLAPGAERAVAMSTSGGPIGSPCYMSPEQMQSARDIDVRTDVWSLGVTLFELVTGELPFRGQSVVELHAETKSQQPLCLQIRWPDLPAGLEAVLSRCLQFDRQLRFQSVSELALALLPFASNRTGSYVERIVAASSSSATSERTADARRALDPMVKTRVSAAAEPVFITASLPHRIAHASWFMVAGAAVFALASWIAVRRAGAVLPSPTGAWIVATAPAPTVAMRAPIAPPVSQAQAASSASSGTTEKQEDPPSPRPGTERAPWQPVPSVTKPRPRGARDASGALPTSSTALPGSTQLGDASPIPSQMQSGGDSAARTDSGPAPATLESSEHLLNLPSRE